VLGARTVNLRDPVIMRVANSWIILNVGGGPTEDKPDVVLEAPSDPTRTSAFLNIRFADITRHIASGARLTRSSSPSRRIGAPRYAATCGIRTDT
jgi:hypothetical protein